MENISLPQRQMSLSDGIQVLPDPTLSSRRSGSPQCHRKYDESLHNALPAQIVDAFAFRGVAEIGLLDLSTT